MVSAVLGLQSIYYIKELFYLVFVGLGGGVPQAERFVPGLVFILAVIFLIFIVATTEYHMKKVGRPESWRLFGWTLAIEIGILIIYYLL